MKLIKYLMLIFILLPLPQMTLALDDLSQRRQEGKDLAGELLPEMRNFLNNPSLTKEAQNIMGHENDAPLGAGMSLSEAEMLGARAQESGSANPKHEYQCDKNSCEVGHTLSSQASLERQEAIDQTFVIRDENGKIIDHKAFVDNILQNQKKAAHEFKDSITGTRASCTPKTETFTKITPDTCDSYFDYKQNSCFPQQIVEIDPKYNYSCNKKREVKEKICHDDITSISCKDHKDCDFGGIIRGSVTGDGIVFDVGVNYFTMGTFGNNYWCGNFLVRDSSVSFTLKNAMHIKEFVLEQVKFDDYIQVSINDHTVYVGPDGGTHLEVVTRTTDWGKYLAVFNGIEDRIDVERNTEWHFYPNIDLLPYLKEGNNVLKTRLIIGGCGEQWLKVRAKARCCTDWDIKRETKCTYQ